MPKRILIVEDEYITALDLKYQIESDSSFECDIVPSGEEALEKLSEKRYELILMDIILKGNLNGIQTASIIQSQSKIPIIYITGNTDLVKSKRARETKPAKILIKPVVYKQLTETIKECLA